MGVRRQGRECALQMLFQIDITADAASDVFRSYFAEKTIADEVREFATSLVNRTLSNRDRSDELLRSVAEHWRLERMAAVDRSILRLAVAELLSDPETPAVVVIDEAIDLAKRFSSGESGSFINGILDAVRRLLPDRVPAPEAPAAG